jgi:hypothetical protein
VRKPKVELAWTAANRLEDALKEARDELTVMDVESLQRLIDGVLRGHRARLEAAEVQG